MEVKLGPLRKLPKDWLCKPEEPCLSTSMLIFIDYCWNLRPFKPDFAEVTQHLKFLMLFLTNTNGTQKDFGNPDHLFQS